MNIFRRTKRWYILQHYAVPHDLWLEATQDIRVLQGLSAVEKAHLRELSTLFLHEKNLIGININVTDVMRVKVAALACLPILSLGLCLFSNWRTVVIYPDAFYAKHNETDEFGFVHQSESILIGEAWQRGPVILSWADIARDTQHREQGHHVVIHEIAHKLDMLNGVSNGMPPLHTNMPVAAWTAAFTQAYQQLQQAGADYFCWIDSYAATNPAECFAVLSEYFFCAPVVLDKNFPDVYQQLCLYYRQDPLQRWLVQAKAATND